MNVCDTSGTNSTTQFGGTDSGQQFPQTEEPFPIAPICFDRSRFDTYFPNKAGRKAPGGWMTALIETAAHKILRIAFSLGRSEIRTGVWYPNAQLNKYRKGPAPNVADRGATYFLVKSAQFDHVNQPQNKSL